MASASTKVATGVDLHSGRSSPNHPPSHSYDPRDSERPPTYVENETNLRDRVLQLAREATDDGQGLPILEYPPDPDPNRAPAHRLHVLHQRQGIVQMYFDAIKTRKDEVVALLIETGLVTTETTNDDGRTPLLAAVEAGNVRTVQQLMDFDADVNAFGITAGMPVPLGRRWKPYPKSYRTPLQLAAEKGNITIVKLLMETYRADDSLVAPDGELALRLAASNGHREIVKYLPARRGGGFRRWKKNHQKFMRRTKHAARSIYEFFKIVLWYIPKGLLWDAPKHCIVLPMVRGARWLSEHRKKLPMIIAEWLEETVKRIWEFVKNVPKKTWRFVKSVPEALRSLAKNAWKVVKKIPKAARIALLWVWDGIKNVGSAIRHIFTRFFSFIHTVLAAIASFFRDLTWTNLWDGFQAFLHAIFVDFPKKIWSWLCKFEEVSYKVLKALFGVFGCIIWIILRGLVEVVIHVPARLGVVLISCGQSMVSGCKEILIWIDPKRS